MNIGDVKLETNSISLFIKVYILSRLHNRQYNIHLKRIFTILSSGIILKILFVEYKNWLNLISWQIFCQ